MCNDDEARMQLRNGRGRGGAKREEAPRGAPDLRPAPAALSPFLLSPAPEEQTIIALSDYSDTRSLISALN